MLQRKTGALWARNMVGLFYIRMSLLSLLCVGVVFEERSPSVIQAGPELEIPTLNLQEAGIRGVFPWVLCGFLLYLFCFVESASCSSGWPQTSRVIETSVELLILGLHLSGAGKTGLPRSSRHRSLGWT